MINLQINGQCLQAAPGTTLLELARRHDIVIPTLCHLPGREARSVCRLCVVEVAGQERLFPACSTAVSAGMVVRTHSQKCIHTRQVLMEFIIAEHGGLHTLSPPLRALAAELGVSAARFALTPQHAADGNRYGSDYIRLQQDKCIHCDRCIAACRDHHIIHRAGRGANTQLTFGTHNTPLAETPCTSCGDCVAVCPTGALSEQG
jgi:NADH dehydrogenase/NADH:ubiquinone oxidoreductase subunit G